MQTAQENIRELRAALEKSEREKNVMAKEMESMQVQWDNALADLAVKSHDLSAANHQITELKRKGERDNDTIARLNAEVSMNTLEMVCASNFVS